MAEDPRREPGRGWGGGRGRSPGERSTQDQGDGGPDQPAPRGGWAQSRRPVLFVAVILLVFYLVSQYALGPDQMGCTQGLIGGTQWSQQAVGARLTDLWSRGSEGFDVTDAVLAHLTVAWAADGTIVKLAMQGKTSVGLQLTLSSSNPSGSATMTVRSDSAALGTSTTVGGSEPGSTEGSSVGSPLLSGVLGSIDAVGFEGLKEATGIVFEDEQGLMVELEADAPSQRGPTVAEQVNGSLAFSIVDGDLAPLEQTVTTSSLGPVQVFAVSKARIGGGGAERIAPPLAFLFVR